MPLDPAAIQQYVGRDWSGARDRKRAYWRERLDSGGIRDALEVTEQLRRWMMRVDGNWPTQAQRDEDFRTHARVAEALAKTRPLARATRVRTRRIR